MLSTSRSLSIFVLIIILFTGCTASDEAPPANSSADGKQIIDSPLSPADSARAIEGSPRVECYMHQEKAFCVSNENIMTHDDPAAESYFADLEAAQDVTLHCGADTFYYPFSDIDSDEFNQAFLANKGIDGINPDLDGRGAGAIPPGEHFFADLTIPAMQRNCQQENQISFEERDSEINLYAQPGNKEAFLKLLDQLNELTEISAETETAIDEMEGRIAEYCEENQGDYHPETGNAPVLATKAEGALSHAAAKTALTTGVSAAMNRAFQASSGSPKFTWLITTVYETQSSDRQVVKVYFSVWEEHDVGGVVQYKEYYDFFYIAEFLRNKDGELSTVPDTQYSQCGDCSINVDNSLKAEGLVSATARVMQMNEDLKDANEANAANNPPDEQTPDDTKPDGNKPNEQCEEGECDATTCEQMVTWWNFNKKRCTLSSWNTYHCQRLLGFPDSCGIDSREAKPGPDGWLCQDYPNQGVPELTARQQCQMNKLCSLDEPTCCVVTDVDVITPIERGGGVCGDPHAKCTDWWSRNNQ